MNNELGRKITSLTLMTIMVAGGLTFAIPGVMPAAHAANPNLFVSAENSQFDNYMSGPQVIEVVVIDSDINDTDEAKGEPDVTVNGKILRMVQGVDGNWYGYFADRTQASIADSTSTVKGEGLDFGTLCATGAATNTAVGVDVSDTVGIALPVSLATGQNGTADGAPLTATCTNGANATGAMNVVREAKDVNTSLPAADSIGQIGIGSIANWPFIQLYPLNPTGNVVIQYNKGGGAQSTTLTFDTVDHLASSALDRSVYPNGAQVHVTIIDPWLNIDPTDEDSWTFGTNSTYVAADVSATDSNGLSTNYQVFDENGVQAGANVTGGIIDISNTLPDMMIEDNGVLILDVNAQSATSNVLTLQDNDDSVLTCLAAQAANTCFATNGAAAGGLGNNTQPITITEQGPNSGVFGSFDESDNSVIVITNAAARGTSATIDYNETPLTVLVGFDFATIDIQPIDDEWSSGEEIPVTIVDFDQNKNSHQDEDLDLNNPSVTLIPALVTGDPFTLGEAGTGAAGTIPQQALYTAWPGTTLTTGTISGNLNSTSGHFNATATISVDAFSDRALITNTTNVGTGPLLNATSLIIDLGTTAGELKASISDTTLGTAPAFTGFNLFNLDARSISTTGTFDVYLLNTTAAGGVIQNISVPPAVGDGLIDGTATIGVTGLVDDVSAQSLTLLNTTVNAQLFDSLATNTPNTNPIGLAIVSSTNGTVASTGLTDPIVADFFSFGFTDDGVQVSERISNQIIRIEAEESGDNTSTFEGSLEYVMVNQLNIIQSSTFTDITPIADDPSFIVIEDLTDEDSPRVSYNDLGADGVVTPISDQEEAPSHSGVVSLNQDSYKIADTVVVTLEDLDLNVDSDLIEIYTVVDLPASLDAENDVVGADVGIAASGTNLSTLSFGSQGRLLDITFDDTRWTDAGPCVPGTDNDGLGATGFTLVETDIASGQFTGDFQIPSLWCRIAAGAPETATGLDIEVNYVDYRDASGEVIEVGDSAGVRANTGSVSLDRTVYPVPFGVPADTGGPGTSGAPSGRSVFPVHATGLAVLPSPGLDPGEFLVAGDLIVHIRVNDPDFDVNPAGEDSINANTTATTVGPVKISVIRGSDSVVLGYAGGPAALEGPIDVGDNNANATRQLGPISEIAPDAGIYELDLTIRYTDGPASTTCPTTTVFTDIVPGAGTTELFRFDEPSTTGDYCILQGDILQVEYTDPADASGDPNTVTDSATFDLRNGVLQSDKSVYIIGSDMILTLIEPDFDLDNDSAETYDLDLIEWDSDAATTTMGNLGGPVNAAAFDPEPTDFRETGDSTGIFQIVIEIPDALSTDSLERGEEVILEYTDWGPSGSDYVGDEDEDVNITIFTSNFGATVELDQKVYTWTDKVYITIVAPDHNFDGDLVDEIGDSAQDPIKISTRGFNLDNYKLVETGTDTGIFTGEVILTGFSSHDADGDGTTADATGTKSADGGGPTDGLLPSDDDDGLTVSFEFSEDETVVGSSLVRWNIGEVQWLEASYPASGTGVVRIIDPDMNLNPEAVDNFDVDVWSDSDAGGIDLTVTETNEATGIFEGTVFFTTTDESSGHRLRVAEGDTVTAEYEDNTLPDPYTTADELDITATSLIGTVVPPLERAPAANLRIVDAFGNSLDSVSVDQQVQISVDLANGQDREQTFAYLVQIQDGNGVTVSLAWITGSLSAGQSFSPALSWIPTESGSYTATAFVWESVDNPTALSPPVTTTINVS